MLMSTLSHATKRLTISLLPLFKASNNAVTFKIAKKCHSKRKAGLVFNNLFQTLALTRMMELSAC